MRTFSTINANIAPKKAQISQRFSRAVVSEALSGQLLLRDASQLLGGIKSDKIATFAKELGV